jgi:hypothetical protein
MPFLGLRKRERLPEQTVVAEEPGGNGTAMAPPVEGNTGGPEAGTTRAPIEGTRAPVEGTRAPYAGTARPPFEGATRLPVEGTTRAGALGLGIVGFLILLAGGWAGIVPYVGPTFGYSSHGQASWQWNLQHSLLYLVPGAVAVVAGLMLIGIAGRVVRGRGKVGSSLLGLIVAACGAWLVLGPVVWPLFYSSPVFTSGSAWDNFIYQLGYNLGPGLLLVLLSGVAIGLSARAGRVMTTARPTTVPETGESPWVTRQSA